MELQRKLVVYGQRPQKASERGFGRTQLSVYDALDPKP